MEITVGIMYQFGDTEEEVLHGLQIASVNSIMFRAELNTERMSVEHDREADIYFKGNTFNPCNMLKNALNPMNPDMCHFPKDHKPLCPSRLAIQGHFKSKGMITHRIRLSKLSFTKYADKLVIHVRNTDQLKLSTKLVFSLFKCNENSHPFSSFEDKNAVNWHVQKFCSWGSEMEHFTPSSLTGLPGAQLHHANTTRKKLFEAESDLLPWYSEKLCRCDGGVVSIKPLQPESASPFIGSLVFSWKVPAKKFAFAFGAISDMLKALVVKFPVPVNASLGKFDLFFPTTKLPQCFLFSAKNITAEHTFCRMTAALVGSNGAVEWSKQLLMQYSGNVCHDTDTMWNLNRKTRTSALLVPASETEFSACLSEKVSWNDAQSYCAQHGWHLPSIHSKQDMVDLFHILNENSAKLIGLVSQAKQRRYDEILYQPLGVYIGLKVVSYLIFFVEQSCIYHHKYSFLKYLTNGCLLNSDMTVDFRDRLFHHGPQGTQSTFNILTKVFHGRKHGAHTSSSWTIITATQSL